MTPPCPDCGYPLAVIRFVPEQTTSHPHPLYGCQYCGATWSARDPEPPTPALQMELDL